MSVQEMQGWLRDEIRDSAKAHELRTKDATQLVEEYAAGKLTPEEATQRVTAYDRRWGGEALFGTAARDGVTDEQIVAEIDRARAVSLDPEGFRRANLQRGRTGKPDQSR
jgi:hypothetical protein